jgi:hypothetical protein
MTQIGNNGPATIVLQAGVYTISSRLSLVGGFGLPVKLLGAGSGSTTLKTWTGFNDNIVVNFSSSAGSLEGLTLDTTLGGTVTSSGNGYIIGGQVFTDVIFKSRANNIAPNKNAVFKDCTITGYGIYQANITGMLFDNVVFNLCQGTSAAITIWGGIGLCVQGCTVQDLDVNGAETERGRGRMFNGTMNFGALHNLYFESNETIAIGVPNTQDGNSGEQIMLEGNLGTLHAGVITSTASTTTLGASPGTLTAYARQAVIVSGKGLGQWRAITSGTGGVITIERDWDVTPDATSTVNVVGTVSNLVVYGNTFDGRWNIEGTNQGGDASTALSLFGGGLGTVFDGNTVSNLKFGYTEWTGYPAVSEFSGSCAVPVTGTLYQNNVSTSTLWAFRIMDSGPYEGEAISHANNVYRNSDFTLGPGTYIGLPGNLYGTPCGIVIINGQSTGGGLDLDVFEDLSIVNCYYGQALYEPNGTNLILVKNCTFDRGSANA